jgi:hypothetical protein
VGRQRRRRRGSEMTEWADAATTAEGVLVETDNQVGWLWSE